MPPLRRKDSFGLEFSFYPSMDAVSEVILEKMNMKTDDILGIQNLNRNKVVIKVANTQVFESCMRRFEDQEVILGNLSKVRVTNLSATYTYVSVRNAPFELDDSYLISVLSRYGKVDNVRHNKFSLGPFKGLYNGTRTVKMVVRENIPSSCAIRGYNVTFMYNGQIKTCFKCGMAGHLVKDCEILNTPVTNIFHDDDFPDMGISSKSNENINKEDASSQSTIPVDGDEEKDNEDAMIGEADLSVVESNSKVNPPEDIAEVNEDLYKKKKPLFQVKIL